MTVQGATDGENTSTIDLKGKKGFEVGEGAEVVLDTVKITGAKAADGALINNESGTVTLKDVEVAENSKPTINNGSTMNLSGTNNIDSGIGGNGTTNITDGQTTLGAKLTQKKVNVKSDRKRCDGYQRQCSKQGQNCQRYYHQLRQEFDRKCRQYPQ